MITHGQALAAAAVALCLIGAGVTWAFGPVGLIAFGTVLLVVALLAPERETRGEPMDSDPRRPV